MYENTKHIVIERRGVPIIGVGVDADAVRIVSFLSQGFERGT